MWRRRKRIARQANLRIVVGFDSSADYPRRVAANFDEKKGRFHSRAIITQKERVVRCSVDFIALRQRGKKRFQPLRITSQRREPTRVYRRMRVRLDRRDEIDLLLNAGSRDERRQ